LAKEYLEAAMSPCTPGLSPMYRNDKMNFEKAFEIHKVAGINNNFD
jgi:hypothetical protein